MDAGQREVVMAANDEGARPIRVLGLLQQCPMPATAQMTLLSLEAWTTFFALRWFFGATEPSDEIDLRLQAGLDWECVDDRGNEYAGGDYGGGGGNSPHWVQTTWFAPAVHPRARTLTLRFASPVSGSPIEVDVDLDAGDNPQRSTSVEP